MGPAVLPAWMECSTSERELRPTCGPFSGALLCGWYNLAAHHVAQHGGMLRLPQVEPSKGNKQGEAEAVTEQDGGDGAGHGRTPVGWVQCSVSTAERQQGSVAAWHMRAATDLRAVLRCHYGHSSVFGLPGGVQGGFPARRPQKARSTPTPIPGSHFRDNPLRKFFIKTGILAKTMEPDIDDNVTLVNTTCLGCGSIVRINSLYAQIFMQRGINGVRQCRECRNTDQQAECRNTDRQTS